MVEFTEAEIKEVKDFREKVRKEVEEKTKKELIAKRKAEIRQEEEDKQFNPLLRWVRKLINGLKPLFSGLFKTLQTAGANSKWQDINAYQKSMNDIVNGSDDAKVPVTGKKIKVESPVVKPVDLTAFKTGTAKTLEEFDEDAKRLLQ